MIPLWVLYKWKYKFSIVAFNVSYWTCRRNLGSLFFGMSSLIILEEWIKWFCSQVTLLMHHQWSYHVWLYRVCSSTSWFLICEKLQSLFSFQWSWIAVIDTGKSTHSSLEHFFFERRGRNVTRDIWIIWRIFLENTSLPRAMMTHKTHHRHMGVFYGPLDSSKVFVKK